MFNKIVRSIQDWSERNPEKAETILAWADRNADSTGFQVANAVAEAGANTWVALGRPGSGSKTESYWLYHIAYNSGLEGQKRAAAIKRYLEHDEQGGNYEQNPQAGYLLSDV